MLIPSAWIRALRKAGGVYENDLFRDYDVEKIISDRFEKEGLVLPKGGESWQNLSANIFRNVNGKEILYSGVDSLFQQLRVKNEKYSLNKTVVAGTMLPEEIHNDVQELFGKIDHILESKT